MSIITLVVLLGAACLYFVVLGPGCAQAAADPQLSDREVQIRYALRIHDQARHAWRGWNEARGCFGLKHRPFRTVPVPTRDAGISEWRHAGLSWNNYWADLRIRTATMLWKMRHPGGNGAARWCARVAAVHRP